MTSWIQPDGPHAVYVDINQHVDQLWNDASGWHWQDLTATVNGPLAAVPDTISGQVTAGGSGVSGVTVSLSGRTAAGTAISQSVTTDSNGNYSLSAPVGGSYTVTPSDDSYTFDPASASFNGLSANQSVNFTGYTNGVSTNPSTPDPPPAPYPNYLASAPVPPAGSCNITGNWVDSVSGATWSLTQLGSNVAGTLQLNAGACGTTTWTVGGQISGNVAGLSGSIPTPAFNACSQPAATTVQAAASFASCNAAAVKESATIPSYVNSFGNTVPGYFNAGTGTLTLASASPTFTLSSPSQISIPGAPNNAQMIPMSTGDSPQITTTASIGSYPVDVIYSSPLETNPHSTCNASVSAPEARGTGSASSHISASPSGCSGIFGVYGNDGATTTQNVIDVVVPPQALIQVLYGEAHGQAVTGDAVSEPAIGSTIRNRFGDTVYFPGVNTYQDAITPSQFMGINAAITTGTAPELSNAALIYGGVTTDAMNVGNCKCFFTPDATGWTKIQAALNSGTTTLPAVNFDPKCFSSNRQFVYKGSIGNNTNGSGAPAFIFEQWRKSTDPAVTRIP